MADLQLRARTALSGCLSLQGPAETGSCDCVARDNLYSKAEMQALLVCVHRHRHCGQA